MGSSSNYSYSAVEAPDNAAALTINQRPLNIAATPGQSSVYGAAMGALAYGVEAATGASGLVNGDGLTGALSTNATPASNVGASYQISQGSLAASPNYALSFTGATYAVTPAALTLTYRASAAAMIYGQSVPALSGTVSASGLVNGDVLSTVTTGSAQWTSPASPTRPVGAYAITGSGLVGSSSNYSYSAVEASDNAAALTIMVNPLAYSTATFLRRICWLTSGPASCSTLLSPFMMDGSLHMVQMDFSLSELLARGSQDRQRGSGSDHGLGGAAPRLH